MDASDSNFDHQQVLGGTQLEGLNQGHEGNCNPALPHHCVVHTLTVILAFKASLKTASPCITVSCCLKSAHSTLYLSIESASPQIVCMRPAYQPSMVIGNGG